MILLVDNYDSFTYNLYQLLAQYDEVKVLRNDDANLLASAQEADALVLSPGPGHPAQAGLMVILLQKFAAEKPILGICLGHQAMSLAFGGEVTRSKTVRHGKLSRTRQSGQSPLFAGLADDFDVMRYHSLVVPENGVPTDFSVLARAHDDGEIMAMAHKNLPIYGIQFHPESVGTTFGAQMIENFVQIVKNDY